MNDKHIEEILEHLPQLVIELDPDPTSRGPAYLQDLIYQTRNMLNTTGIYIQEVLKWKGKLESTLEALEVAFQIDSDELLANEPRVNRLPAVQDRLAMINVILRDQRKAILEKRKEVNDAGHVEKAIRHRHRELEHTMSAIRLQRSLIETEHKTGSYFGDEGSESRSNGTWGRNRPKDDDIDEDELAHLMERITSGEDEDEEIEVDEEGEGDSEDGEEVDEEGVDSEDEDGEEPEILKLDMFDDDVSLDADDPLLCSVCGEPQQETADGLICKNDHGGGSESVEVAEEVEVGTSNIASEPAVELDPEDLPDTDGKPDEDEPEDPAIEQFLDGEPPGEEDFSDIFDQLDNEV
jgi:hypothetical protein